MPAAERPARGIARARGGPWLIPHWTALILALFGLGLIPWAVYLFVTLPPDYTANHWWLAWGGFDVALIAVLLLTALAVARRSAYAELAATVAGTLLVCDVWFDVLTSRGTADLTQAILGAVFVELPLAALCFWMASNLVRAIETVRPFLRAAGFTVRDHRLVPPESATDDQADPSARMPGAADHAGGT